MSDLHSEKIPQEALQAFQVVEGLHGRAVGGHLLGSAVSGSLRINSDVDVLVVVDQNLTEVMRIELTGRLMLISGKIGNPDAVRPLEVTVVKQGAVVPWKFPPQNECVYGEWLRGANSRTRPKMLPLAWI